MNSNIEIILAVIGAFSVGFATYKGLSWLWRKAPWKSFKNPIKTYIRKEVIEYLKQLKNE